MAFIYRDWRILASILIAACLVIGAYVLATGASRPPIAEAATETALLQAVASKDSTGDGLPDWEKSLYGIPLNATSTDYFGLGMTDGEAAAKGLIVPKAASLAAPAASTPGGSTSIAGVSAPAIGSLTDLFAKQFFTLFVTTEQSAGGTLTSDQVNALADQALTQLENSISPAPDFATMAQIKQSASGIPALSDYAATAEEVFAAHQPAASKDALTYLSDVVQKDDSSAASNISDISSAFHDTASGLLALSVPPAAARAHLALINALMRLSGITSDFARERSDPLATMLALNQYADTLASLSAAFIQIKQVYSNAGIILQAGQPGAFFVNAANKLSPTP